MPVTRAAVLAKASEWVGMQERTGNNDIWFADDWGITGQSWCFAFTQSCFYYADPTPTGKLPHQAMFVPYGVQWARDNGQSVEPDNGGTPIPGDIVFFTWGGGYGRWTPGTGDHVGVVEGWDGGDWISTIEGNVGPRDGVSNPQGVWRRDRSISGTVICYWRPTVYIASEEEDVTPEQDAKLTRIDGNATWLQAVVANTDMSATLLLRDIYNNCIWNNQALNRVEPSLKDARAQVETVAAAATQQRTALATTLGLVQGIVSKISGGGPAVVDVAASLRLATIDQLADLGPAKLLAALAELLPSQQPDTSSPDPEPPSADSTS